MKIFITKENFDKIEEALRAGQKYAKVRRADLNDVIFWFNEIKQKFASVADYRLKGTTVWINVWAQRFPNAYDGIPMGTWICIERYSRGWALTAVCRSKVTQRSTYVDLSEKAAEGILRNYQTI